MPPWERYASQQQPAAGPWAKYQTDTQSPVPESVATAPQAPGMIEPGNVSRNSYGSTRTAEFADNGIHTTAILPALHDQEPNDLVVERYRRGGQQMGKFDTEQSAQNFLNPGAKAPLGQSPFRGGRRGELTMDGSAWPLKTPVPSMGQLANDWGSVAKGAGIGAVSGVPGIPGDIESLGRLLLSPAGVSRETALPTSTDVGNTLFGQPKNRIEENARMAGTMVSPGGYGRALRLADNTGGFLAQQAAGLTSGAGGASVEAAYQSGRVGGQAADTFLTHMRQGHAVSADAVRMARDAVEELRHQRTAAYRQGIGSTIQGDPTVLNFQPIDDAITRAAGVGTYRGVPLSGGAERVRERIGEVVAEWRAMDPAQFHTPEGLDALKKRIGNLAYEEDLRNVAGPNTPGSVIVRDVYNAVRDQVNNQAPGYARVMQDYTRATEELREIESTFSLGRNASTDTSLRKLQSIFRNNANTNYGARVQAGQRLNDVGTGEMVPALAGQALNSATPRGIQGPLAGIGGLATLATNPQYLPALALTSPRLIGEAAFALGNARRGAGNLANTLQNAVIPGGGAGIPSIAGITPQMLAAMTPQMLAQLLATQTPARQ